MVDSKNVQISVSILSANFAYLADEIKKCEDAGADFIHIDVMDGHFVPNISIGLCIIEAVKKVASIPIDTHLMIENPWLYLDQFIDVGSDMISIHAECYGSRREECRKAGAFPKEIDVLQEDKLCRDLRYIKDRGAKAFVVVNPGTPLCFGKAQDDCDGVLIMSVNPGFSGQSFDERSIAKIEELRKGFDGYISVDGGVNNDTGKRSIQAGANILAMASYFFNANNPKEVLYDLKMYS